VRVVGCFLEYDGKVLILLRHSHKPLGDTWGLPAGKVERGESDKQAMVRELAEESGYQASEDELEYIGHYDIGQGNTFVSFHLKLTRPHKVKLETAAHSAYKWVTPEECYALPNPIPHLRNVLKFAGYLK
jgi:8-oxo-dGTP pyrophosphatase MutT (NUDIX family)